MVNIEPYVVIGKKWLFELPEAHAAQSNGIVLTDIRNKIWDLDRVAPAELGKGYRTPECLRGWLLGKNDVPIADGQCLSDIDIIMELRASNVMNTYQFRCGVIRKQ